MILSVHAIFGAAAASLVPSHPVMAFGLGFASHFVLDAIPHRDYDLISIESDLNKKNKVINIIRNKFKLIRDVVFVLVDGIVGLCLAFMLFFNPIYPWIFFLGAFGALIPDGLTFLYLLLKHKPLNFFFNFHSDFIHSKKILKLIQVTGVILQFCTLIIIFAVIFGIKYLFFL